jgi:hypothetical protein
MLSVFIEGDKEGLNSKSAVDKFKSYVKNNSNFTVEDLSTKFVKADYTLELVSKSDTEVRFTIKKKESKVNNKELFKAKLKMIRDERTNVGARRALQDENVPDEITKEYLKAKKMLKVPIPQPSEIFAKPEEYKSLVSMVLNNDMMRHLGSNHPYVRYFKLVAEKLNVTETTYMNTNQPSKEPSLPQSLENLMKMAGPQEVMNIRAKEMNNDTDSEEEVPNLISM